MDILEALNKVIHNFVKHTAVIKQEGKSEDEYEREIEEIVPSVFDHVIAGGLLKIKRDIIRVETPGASNEYADECSFEEYYRSTIGHEPSLTDPTNIGSVRAYLIHNIVHSIIPTFGIHVGNPDMIKDPVAWFNDTFKDPIQMEKLYRYLDCMQWYSSKLLEDQK